MADDFIPLSKPLELLDGGITRVIPVGASFCSICGRSSCDDTGHSSRTVDQHSGHGRQSRHDSLRRRCGPVQAGPMVGRRGRKDEAVQWSRTWRLGRLVRSPLFVLDSRLRPLISHRMNFGSALYPTSLRRHFAHGLHRRYSSMSRHSLRQSSDQSLPARHPHFLRAKNRQREVCGKAHASRKVACNALHLV